MLQNDVNNIALQETHVEEALNIDLVKLLATGYSLATYVKGHQQVFTKFVLIVYTYLVLRCLRHILCIFVSHLTFSGQTQS